MDALATAGHKVSISRRWLTPLGATMVRRYDQTNFDREIAAVMMCGGAALLFR